MFVIRTTSFCLQVLTKNNKKIFFLFFNIFLINFDIILKVFFARKLRNCVGGEFRGPKFLPRTQISNPYIFTA